jgi:hypothetical protein
MTSTRARRAAVGLPALHCARSKPPHQQDDRIHAKGLAPVSAGRTWGSAREEQRGRTRAPSLRGDVAAPVVRPRFCCPASLPFEADARHRQRHGVHQRGVPRPARRARRRPPSRRLPRPGLPSVHRELVLKLKQRCVWREEFETLDDARAVIGAYVERYHHRPHPRLAYRTPREVAATWKDPEDQSIPAA